MFAHIRSGPVGSNSSLNVDYLAELDGDTLNLYGSGALEALDKNWGMGAAGSVTSIVFKFVDFEEISKHIHKVRARFPSVHVSPFLMWFMHGEFMGGDFHWQFPFHIDPPSRSELAP